MFPRHILKKNTLGELRAQLVTAKNEPLGNCKEPAHSGLHQSVTGEIFNARKA
jgi:hypothetical protein